VEWIDATKELPVEYREYVCLIDGKIATATLREFVYDVRRPNWDRDGVTHYLSGVPEFPNGIAPKR
jgi:hypothetical protein